MNTKSLRYTVAALAMQCLLVAAPAPAQASGGGDDRSPVLSNWEIEAATGLSLTEIGNRWWAFAFEHLDFLFDTTGEFSAQGDVPGPLFFAEGSSGEPVNLRADVPKGQLLVLPIATYNWTLFDPCAEPRCARHIINDNFIAGVRDVYLKIDGERVDDIDSLLVKVSRSNPAIFLVDAGPIQDDGFGGILPSLQGGYWAVLRPLSPGRHVLEFGAKAPELDGLTGERTGGRITLKARLTVTVAGCRDRRRCDD